MGSDEVKISSEDEILRRSLGYETENVLHFRDNRETHQIVFIHSANVETDAV